MILLKQPSLEEVTSKLRLIKRRRFLVVLIGEFSVEYKGRAHSKLSCGERMLLIKPDNTLLIHNSKGRNPVNWMKEKTIIETRLTEDYLVIKGLCINPRETIRIRIKSVKALLLTPFASTGRLEIIGTEADMAKMIYEHPELISKNFKPIHLEEQTKYGFIDVMGYEKDKLVLIECKRYKAGLSAVQQLRRYVERVKKSKGVQNVRGVLAAPSITENAKNMLKDWGFTYKKVNPPKYLIAEKDVQKTLTEY